MRLAFALVAMLVSTIYLVTADAAPTAPSPFLLDDFTKAIEGTTESGCRDILSKIVKKFGKYEAYRDYYSSEKALQTCAVVYTRSIKQCVHQQNKRMASMGNAEPKMLDCLNAVYAQTLAMYDQVLTQGSKKFEAESDR